MKKVLLGVVISIFFATFCFGVKVKIVGAEQGNNIQSDSSGDGQNYLLANILNMVNDYLWFFIGVISMGVLIWGGYLLMSSEGDDTQFKKGNKLVIYAVVGIIIALSAYLIVRLAENLF